MDTRDNSTFTDWSRNEAKKHRDKMEWMYGPGGVLSDNFPTGKKPEIDERVRLHVNLNKKCYSLSRYYKPNGTWYVVRNPKRIILRDVEFKVSQAGRKRAVESGVRNVHAYAYGKFVQMDEGIGERGAEGAVGFMPIRYNPFKHGYFYVPEMATGDEDWPMHDARWLVGTERGIMVFPRMDVNYGA